MENPLIANTIATIQNINVLLEPRNSNLWKAESALNSVFFASIDLSKRAGNSSLFV